MLENYKIAKKAVEEKIGTEHEFYPLMVSALYGLLTKYKNHKEIVLKVWKETNIIIEEGKIEDILKRHNIGLDVYNYVPDDENAKTYGVSNQGNTFLMDDEGNITFEKEKPFLICSKDANPYNLLNTFIHELSHLIKGDVNGSCQEQEEDTTIFIIRTGLAHYVYFLKENELTLTTAFSILDEAINTIQTTETIEEILSLKEWVEEEKMKRFLEKIKKEDIKDKGYELITPLVRKFWQNETFKEIIECDITEGDIDNIIANYDEIMGEDAFQTLGDLLEEIWQLTEEEKDDEVDERIEKVEKLSEIFKEKTKKPVKTK